MRKASSAQLVPADLRALQNLPAFSACVDQLGSPRAIFKPRSISWFTRVLGLFCCFLGIFILGVFLYTYHILLNWWPWWEAGLVPIIGIAWLLTGLWFTLAPLFSPRLQVIVCPKGLIVNRQHHVDAIPWTMIEALWKDVRVDERTGVTRSYILRRSDGATFIFKNDLRSVKKLGRILEGEVVRHLLPQIIDAYNRGMELPFNELMISKQGIAVKKAAMLPWSDVAYVRMDEFSIRVYARGEEDEWCTIPVSHIPNASVLKGLIEFIMRERNDTPRLRMISAYNAGLSIPFGAIHISKLGVTLGNGKPILPWNEIAAIGVGEREVILKRKGRIDAWDAIPLVMVDDATLLKELVDYITRGSS